MFNFIAKKQRILDPTLDFANCFPTKDENTDQRKLTNMGTLNSRTLQSTSCFDVISDPQRKVNIEHTQKPDFNQTCHRTLLELGFKFRQKGTKLLSVAIIYLYENNLDWFELNSLYKKLREKFKMSTEQVRWNINRSISLMYDNTKLSVLNKHFNELLYGEKPDAKMIISHLVYELRLKYPPSGYDEERTKKILYVI